MYSFIVGSLVVPVFPNHVDGTVPCNPSSVSVYREVFTQSFGGVVEAQSSNSQTTTIDSTPRNTAKKQKKFLKPPIVKTNVNNLLHKVAKVVINGGKAITIIDKKCKVFGQINNKEGKTLLRLRVRHLDGMRRKTDLPTTVFIDDIVRTIASKTQWSGLDDVKTIKPGYSGYVIKRKYLTNTSRDFNRDYIVVRGTAGTRVIDARSTLSAKRVMRVFHCGDAGEKFWRGYNSEFGKMRPSNISHVCTSDLDVVECGQVAAIVTQALFPCGRITCNNCVREYNMLSNIERNRLVSQRLKEAAELIGQSHAHFTHILTLCRSLEQKLSAENGNREAFGRIKFMIGERTNDPFSHVNNLNEILIKGNEITSDEFNRATGYLREIASYLKNRTEHIQKGSLQSFRNKYSAKTHINPALMCDNQLDRNGNFIWGERGYHAKRFFQNYFEVVDPSNGYAKHIVRTNPNGTRKLAIGNLIVSTDLDALRNQLRGEPVEITPLTKQCVSKRHESFIYPCSCVTYDDGTPLASEILTPTKNHIVLGNTGDPKYLDLPADISEKLYIAKEGYCYINIFLAMLVNINENEAKDFTKRVRDIVVNKLGKWPTMADVATECYLLTMFHPDARSAELPRILVDHTAKTMHVIDSFGSLTTGYHILKANTVNQLMQFASDSLESEMKDYIVGGLTIDQTAHTHLLQLARSVFKPSLMKQILEDDPYTFCLCVLSPSVLRAMFTSTTYSYYIQQAMGRDMTLSQIIMISRGLAQRVVLTDAIDAQLSVLSDGYSSIQQVLSTGCPQSMACKVLKRIMDQEVAEREVNVAVVSNGYFDSERTIRIELEKIYLAELKASFNELSYFGKLREYSHTFNFTPGKIHEHVKLGFERWRSGFAKSLDAVVMSTRGRMISSVNKVKSVSTSCISNICVAVITQSAKQLMQYLPSFANYVNTLCIIGVILNIARMLQVISAEHKRLRLQVAEHEHNEFMNVIETAHATLRVKIGDNPTYEEFVAYLKGVNPQACARFERAHHDFEVEHQAKGNNEIQLERIVAFAALLMMVIDAERSDALYKTLNKLKGLVGTIEQPVAHQSLDEIKETFDMNETITFDIVSDSKLQLAKKNPTFQQWWNNQISYNNVVPHYRTEGVFLEFTRLRAGLVAQEIANSTNTDFLVRGAVGSGKSTGLPYHLSKKGPVLLIEPTKPLTENVCAQLRSEPFFASPTMRYRGSSTFGSTPISVMTSGFALHYYAHNRHLLNSFDFIIIDECHVLDSNSMALVCLLHEIDYKGKLLKVSATPPGREVELTTQFPVDLVTETTCSLQRFANEQGVGSAIDATKYGQNILVYVASYTEVDQLSKDLIAKNYNVTKIDGRTMKMGPVAIKTSGTTTKPHYIVATNIIENGVTLDIEVVVDFGLKVVAEIDEDNRMIHYNKRPISFGERIQRIGRVGRHKKGTAIRIGVTEKGLIEVPTLTATEAAFTSFAYGLPVMTANVSTNLLQNCTILQARVAQMFELPIYFTVPLIRFDGTMHPSVHALLTKYKLNESTIQLSKLAIPHSGVNQWLTAEQYSRCGARLAESNEMRLPFYSKDVPERLYEELWGVVTRHRCDAGFTPVRSASIARIAYTLRTDPASIHRTIQILDGLICSENEKKAQFEALTTHSCMTTGFTLNSIVATIRSRYACDYTAENIGVLQAAKSQLLEFANLHIGHDTGTSMDDETLHEIIRPNGALETVLHQSEVGVVNTLKLKGKWKKSLLTNDLLLVLGTLGFSSWMLCKHFMNQCTEIVTHQGFNKRTRQKLRFRSARDARIGQEIFADDSTIEHYFGSKYTEKGKTKGRTRGIGTKNRRFINMYGFDPTEYNYVRFVDPVTGETRDESVLVDLGLVTDMISDRRNELIDEDVFERQHFYGNPGIEAYFVKNSAKKALKVDLTPHNPLAVGNRINTISGFPERAGEFRQTGRASEIDVKLVPAEFKIVDHESKSLFRGVRDYNPISSIVCKLQNNSNGVSTSIYGLGFGPYIITNQHLFKHNNGELLVTSRHGDFRVANTTTLLIKPVTGSDIAFIRMPKDFPPFPQRLKFRIPVTGERICLVASNFQDKSISSSVSEASTTYPVQGSTFWKHWIDTKDGHCGLPLVATQDGAIVGIHSLTSTQSEQNYHACVTESFIQTLKDIASSDGWTKHWKYTTEDVCWGSLKLQQSTPTGLFQPTKTIGELDCDLVSAQCKDNWVLNSLRGNLKGVAKSTSQLVTKHVVKGKCVLFQTYLDVEPSAKEYFEPLMGHYAKSVLNKTAYLQDILKYSAVIDVGNVDTDIFEISVDMVIEMLEEKGFKQCYYVTDPMSIINALNLKAATGAIYSGRKRDYFSTFEEGDYEQILYESCLRLFRGHKGIWNGSLKAELRPLEKVLQNKTRTFTAAPLDTLLSGKVCVDDFNNQFYDMNLRCPWTVGMTKFYKGWDTLLRKLPEGWIFCDADGSQFDSSLSPYIINAVLQIRLHFMEEWDIGEQMLKNLYTEIIYTPILTPDGTIIKKCKGNNSGQPSTVVDNSLMVVIAIYYSLKAMKTNVAKIDDFFIFFVNGDDLLIAVHPDYEWVLDGMQEKFSQLGLKYSFTSRTKEKSDLWFMSHKGLLLDNVYIPKLEPERVVSILEWDRSTEPLHRLEAICASMIEAWGYDELLKEIRKFYQWVLEQEPYKSLAKDGKAPYLAETALRKLYLDTDAEQHELEKYYEAFRELDILDNYDVVHQSGEQLDAGSTSQYTKKAQDITTLPRKDKDVDLGTTGTYSVPRLKKLSSKLRLPTVAHKSIANLEHLLQYTPDQTDISNTRATHAQFQKWYEAVKSSYELDEGGMAIVMNGLMVWCIENGTSPNINGYWTMMDGKEQVEFPLKPVLENAKPTFRQIMAHFSDLAEAYIEKRNHDKPYMPRYGLQRNLTDMSLARFAFDFYEMTSTTPTRAREAHLQMKAAALRNASTRLFGLDGKVGNTEEDTERHTAEDVSQKLHSLSGVRGVGV